jgi:hypothetical protein
MNERRIGAPDDRRGRLDAMVGAVAIGVAVALVVTHAILLIAYLVNGESGISDNWVGYLAGITLVLGLGLSAMNFVAALVLRGRLTSRRRRLALIEFPVLVVLIALFEILLGQ